MTFVTFKVMTFGAINSSRFKAQEEKYVRQQATQNARPAFRALAADAGEDGQHVLGGTQERRGNAPPHLRSAQSAAQAKSLADAGLRRTARSLEQYPDRRRESEAAGK